MKKKEYVEPVIEIQKFEIEEKILLNDGIHSSGEPGNEEDAETFVW